MNTLSAIIHGESGVGKSWLLMTMPGPRLILDVEGRLKYTPTDKISWDPRAAVPDNVTDESTVIIKVKDFSAVDLAGQWLASGQHPFRSVGIDSLTETQKRAMDAIRPNQAQPDQQDWGALLRRSEKLVRDFRDLTDHPTNPLQCAVVVTGTQVKNGKQRPLLQGQIADNVPYYFDLNGYYYTGLDQESGESVRLLRIQPDYQVVAKDGTDLLTKHYGAVIRDPNFTEMLEVLNK